MRPPQPSCVYTIGGPSGAAQRSPQAAGEDVRGEAKVALELGELRGAAKYRVTHNQETPTLPDDL
jgi:hypothetical protein